jgi:NTP pyrophosphatase (non-canonical NTP hydrolase)
MSQHKHSLANYQALVAKRVRERGFDGESPAVIFTLLVEEVGELAKAMRKVNKVKMDKTRPQGEVEEEIADIFWYVCVLCNALNIDLAEAFEAKEKKNQKRKWS